MKLIRMHVDNFGGLHDYDYEFADGLNVVLEDNGWGKTTMAAFLKAMLYGFDAKRTRDITENERKRYYPWQGGAYGGMLEFEAEGVRYRVTRSFGETPRFDRVKIVKTDSGTTARIDPDRIGETLFRLDASAFQRSVFINQNGLSIDGAASSIHTRLNALVSQANDVAAYDDAISGLTQRIKVYEKTGARGLLGDITRQIAALERDRDRLEADIALQDSARDRITEIDAQLSTIGRSLEEKKERLEVVSGEARKREASEKLLEELNARIDDLQRQAERIRTDLGGHIPTEPETDQVRQAAQTTAALTEQLDQLAAEYDSLAAAYTDLTERYGGTVPPSARLDEIQRIYGELQGIQTTDAGETGSDEAAPEGYDAISTAVSSDPNYTTRLRNAAARQADIQRTAHELEAQDKELANEQEAWADKRQKYAELKKNVESCAAEAARLERFKTEAVRPVIVKLEELQQLQQLVDVKKAELDASDPVPGQSGMMPAEGAHLPDVGEARAILQKHRDAAKHEADVQGLSARLEGEKCKAESLTASLAQMGAISEDELPQEEEPKRSPAIAMLGAGAVLAVLGVILAAVVTPALAAAAAVGLVLIALGIASNKSYKTKKTAYEQVENSRARQLQAIQKKQETQAELEKTQTSVSRLEQDIAELLAGIESDRAETAAWLSKWAPEETEVSEEAIVRLVDAAELAQKREREIQDTAEKRAYVTEKTAYIENERAQADAAYPEIAGMTYGDALDVLRTGETEYRLSTEKYEAAAGSLRSFLSEAGTEEDLFTSEEAPALTAMTERRAATAAHLEGMLAECREVLRPLGLTLSLENAAAVLRQAEDMLNAYIRFSEQLQERAGRQQKRQKQIDELRARLAEKATVLREQYEDREMPERLARVREDVGKAAGLTRKLSELKAVQNEKSAQLDGAERVVRAFTEKYGHFAAETADLVGEICRKAAEYARLEAAGQPLEEQRRAIRSDGTAASDPANAEEEAALRSRITQMEEQRDALLVEYTQKSDFIRQGDQSLEKYPDVVQEIHELYDQKQKAQNTILILKRTIQLITKAKENLADRYLSRVERLFNSYMHIWLNNSAVRGIVGIDFNVSIEENDKVHVAEGYSTGYCDLIDFCMRLALVDTLFESEQPFLIMDDPFVNLDAERLEKALELLNVMSADKQIIYFICHPIRAAETGENASSRAEFIRLAEDARQTIHEQKTARSEQKKAVRRSPREMYRIADPDAAAALKPADPAYVITNSIFSMRFMPDERGLAKDGTYELFFIDEAGRVLNERQIIEISGGKLSTERIRFCLNTRDDSGEQYELMIRESGQDDYEVAARYPFRAKLAFAGTFSFD